jgi:hypothetical protein
MFLEHGERLFERRVGVLWKGEASKTDLPSAKDFTRAFLNLLCAADSEIIMEDFFLGNAAARAYETCEKLRCDAAEKVFKIVDEVLFAPKKKRGSERIVAVLFFTGNGVPAFMLRFHLTDTKGKWKITAIEQGGVE